MATGGVKLTQAQPLQWARANVVVDGYLWDLDEIPLLLQEGQMEAAMAVINSQDPLADLSRKTDSSTVGPISVTYSAGSSSTTIVRKITNKLRKLLGNGGNNGTSFPVKRG